MATMLQDTAWNRTLICLVIAILRRYGPFCLAYTIWVVAARTWHPLSFGPDKFLNNTILWTLWAPEAVFYVFFLLYSQWIQRAASHPPKRSRDERMALFRKVRSEIFSPDSFLSGWFRGSQPEDIGKEELRRFLDWAFWEGRAGEEGEKGDEQELEEYMDKVELMMSKPFMEGKGKAKSLRLTMDPITIEPRSLVWYSLIGLADTAAITLLMLKGYKYYRRSILSQAAIFPPRPAALLTKNKSPVQDISYFLRPHTSTTRRPILWIHGIGIGLLPYVGFLEELHQALNASADPTDQVGILAIEILQVSSRLTTAIPRRATFLAQITSIINQHFGEESRFVLGSHSYGSVLATHIMNDPSLSPRVSGTLVVDPVSILLHMPDVAYNFTVREPVRANEWLLWYFASKDPQIAHTLGRHFFWSESLLWRDQIDHLITNHQMRFTASLSSDDLIVNTPAVRAYLADWDLPEPVVVEDRDGHKRMQLQTHITASKAALKPWVGKGLEIIWWEGHDHAGVFEAKKDRQKLVDVLVKYVRAT